jgi:hypothetical protein
MKFKMTLAVALLFFSSVVVSEVCAETLVDDNLGFSAQIPTDWQFHRSGRPPGTGRFVYQYGLPKTWSEVEKQEIENSVAITIYDGDFESLKAVQELEDARTADITLTTKVVLSSDDSLLRERKSLIGGLEYRVREKLVVHNKRGYVLSFTATPGTYDKNLHRFMEFTDSFRFVTKKGA